jgi:hypothetical protein
MLEGTMVTELGQTSTNCICVLGVRVLCAGHRGSLMKELRKLVLSGFSESTACHTCPLVDT